MDVGSLIPHRPPFLFIDEVVELEAKRVLARTRVRPDADFFIGHYPGNPIMPGVLVCECAFQAGALLLAAGRNSTNPDPGDAHVLPVLTRIRNASFKRMVKPGDVLDIEVVIDDGLDGVFFMTGRVSVGGKAVVRVEFACAMADVESTGDKSSL